MIFELGFPKLLNTLKYEKNYQLNSNSNLIHSHHDINNNHRCQSEIKKPRLPLISIDKSHDSSEETHQHDDNLREDQSGFGWEMVTEDGIELQKGHIGDHRSHA